MFGLDESQNASKAEGTYPLVVIIQTPKMNESIPEIERALAEALRKTLTDLIIDFPNDNFYYFVLTTVGEALTPGHSIWSEELLDLESEKQSLENKREDKEAVKSIIRYSYADSPLFYHYERHFKKVEELFLDRQPVINNITLEYSEKEFDLRINSMINALKIVDNEKFFGIGKQRERWFLNVEVNPPDGSNLIRAKNFNSKDRIKEWIDYGGE